MTEFDFPISHRVSDLKNPSTFIEECKQSEMWIIRRWANFLKEKDVPFITVFQYKKNGTTAKILKDTKKYSAKELSDMGWKLK